MNQNEQQEQKFIRLTQAPIPTLISSLAIPTIISMLITSFYNMADTFFVGKINTSATAAVGVVFSLMAIIQALGFGFGHGSGNYISRNLGRHDTENASRMAATGFFSALIAGLFLTILGNIFIDPLVRFLGATETIFPYAKDYTRFILIGAPYMTASLVLNNQLRFQGSAFYGMIGIGAGAIINIILDPIFIFVLDMGTAGAGLATILSQFVSFCLLLYGCTKGGNIRLNIKDFTPCVKFYKEILRGGLPSLLRQALGSVASISLNVMARGYGDAAIAAMSVVSRVTMFASSALIGFGQGFQPVCGFNYGARLYNRVKEGFWFCIKVSTGFLFAFAIAGYIFAPNIIRLFTKNDVQVIEMGITALRLQCLTFPFNGLIVLSNMMMQTIGDSGKASILAMARQGLFFLPLVFIMPYFYGILGIQLSQPISDIATFILTIPMTMIVLRKMNNNYND